MPCFKISNMSSGYGDRKILNDLTIRVERGRFAALIGPNGSGKSTLIGVLAGLLPYTGSAELNGRELRTMTRRQFGRLVGVVPQSFRTVYPFPVRDVIAMGRLPHRPLFAGVGAEDEELVAAAAKMTGTDHLLDRSASSLSGGEAQRVLTACVLAQDPEVFLLDEPTSALDPHHAYRLFELFRTLADAGRTVIAAVHDINALLPFADEYVALRDGRIISAGPACELGGSVLRSLYGADFAPYKRLRPPHDTAGCTEKDDLMWHVVRS